MTSGSKVVFSNTFSQTFFTFGSKKIFSKTLVDQNDQKRHFLLHQINFWKHINRGGHQALLKCGFVKVPLMWKKSTKCGLKW